MFLGDFWPHFNQQLKKGLDASLVWSEFMGVIKGSEQSLSTSRGYVSRETYEAMTTKSGLSVARSRVYGLFESYLKQKKVDMYDIPERTHVLIKAIDSIDLMGLSVDYLYVDEVQDNLLLDVCLLRKLCRYPEGLFWAGDSAQTIAVGSSFRFNELTAYLYRAEMSDRAVRNNQRSPVHPQLFELAVNYRSQGGIVNAAASLVEMIIKFFPRSIDLLSKERSKVDGPKPVIFSPVSGSQLQLENFLFGKADAKVEFGAEQVILVRNDAARDKLVEKLGDLALVLTLYESKGLEFNDVLLYDFFEDSPATAADWRVVLNCLNEDNVLAPRFDEIRHAVLQTELKFLYVGLTRAQNRVWIWDTSEKINAMMMLWKTQDLATVQAPEDVSEQIAVQSSKRAWEKRACSLFQQKLYQQRYERNFA
ncbi:hypothetical protein FRC03_007557 [Tulasnella sp. 419]|nr:hypothetical protein FRC03_007557 [Tulasnella sp. 419]